MTTDRTIATTGPEPFVTTAPAPGEPHRRLGERGSLHEHANGAPIVLGTLWHLTDLHVTDPSSPIRAPFLNHLGEPNGPLRTRIGRVGTYRPHEAASAHVLAAMVRQLGSITRAPVFGGAVDLVVASGDLADNAQANEVAAASALLSGREGTLRAPGLADPFEGPGGLDDDPHYWHPEGEPFDEWRTRRGFPQIEGWWSALAAPIPLATHDLPVLFVAGNHDLLLQGTVPASPRLARAAMGGLAPTGVAADLDLAHALADHERTAPDPWRLVVGAPHRCVAPLAERAPLAAITNDYPLPRRIDVGALRLLVLDTTNPWGGWQGSLDAASVRWLVDELDSAHERRLDDEGRWVPAGGSDVAVVLVTHHPIETLVNTTVPEEERPRVGGSSLAALLDHYPNVIAWLAGHTHRHRVRWVRSRLGPYGMLHVTTASLIDWPQQGRIIEVAFDPRAQRLVVATTVVDHAGAVGIPVSTPASITEIAGIARMLAANDPERLGEREPPGRGTPNDRNAIWTLPIPPGLARQLARRGDGWTAFAPATPSMPPAAP
ncbi:metallophosphoesterase [Acidimicrobium ferrooxidans DSM 10331]|uniref:Metallophosphoesterase n=1 Tax=Acidimicrobium ferrooxidans (strain DSM 10331 / JCM 15462 / NBRC 103882 / ICP) TaxID=525909 RepID=C7M002_ACIFD|nr:metallophosphoesterase [Acidimicrobium ferrooxidans]ACU54310.1 metallophosphoesterase [Acidimicrobium ferrooxidans DSM 10331]